jgi:cytochrome P450 family 2 subfamily U polypeptide 1
MKKLVDSKRRTFYSGRMESYIDAFLEEKQKENSVLEGLNDENLIADLRIMFLAGTETTTATLRWGFLYLMAHLDIQRKLQKEIDDVIGRERMPSMEDKLRMPYMEAFIMEVSRKETLIPMGAPHRIIKDVEVNGVFFPKNITTLRNVWAVHHDPKLYPDPFSFRPERFINESGKAVKPDCLIPFGIGKRYCLGEPLARMELFLYLTSILQKFTILPPEDGTISFEGELTTLYCPLSFLSRFVPR